MCGHIYYDLAPVFDDGGNIECATETASCNLLDDAMVVLRGQAVFGDELVYEPCPYFGRGWHRELLWLRHVAVPATPVYDDEIPF